MLCVPHEPPIKIQYILSGVHWHHKKFGHFWSLGSSSQILRSLVSAPLLSYIKSFRPGEHPLSSNSTAPQTCLVIAHPVGVLSQLFLQQGLSRFLHITGTEERKGTLFGPASVPRRFSSSLASSEGVTQLQSWKTSTSDPLFLINASNPVIIADDFLVYVEGTTSGILHSWPPFQRSSSLYLNWSQARPL